MDTQIARQNIVLLCGLPSSGTELLALLLSAHPQIVVRGEFPLLPKLADRYTDLMPAERVAAAIRALKKADIYGCFENPDALIDAGRPTFFGNLFARLLVAGDFTWIGQKTPQNLENLDSLLKLFPQCRVIVLVRDVRDVALSWRSRWNRDPVLLAHKWNSRYRKAIAILGSQSHDRYVVVRYEDLLADSRRESERLCTFLNVPYSERMSRYHEFVPRQLPGKVNYGKPLIKNNVGKYHAGLTQSECQRIEEIAADMLIHFGYVAEPGATHRPITTTEILHGRSRELMNLARPLFRPTDLGWADWIRRVRIELLKRI